MTRESTAKALAASRCPICLDTVEHPASLSVCGHLFCKPCIKAALHAKKECPVCRTEATHRMLRDTAVDGGTSSISGTASTSGRPCLEAGPGADAPFPDGAWTCASCTVANSEAASRCATCHARRPSEYKGRAPEKPQRHLIVPYRPPAKRPKRAKRTDETSLAPVEDEDEDEEEDGDSGDEEVTGSEVGSTAPQSSRTPRMLVGEARGSRTVRTLLSLEAALSPQLRRLEARVVADGASGGAAASSAHSDATPSRDGWPLVRSIWRSKSGFKCVTHNASQRAAKKPWQAKNDDGKSLGQYATPEEAALAYSKVCTRMCILPTIPCPPPL